MTHAAPEPYTSKSARVDAERLYDAPEDVDIYAEVDARLHATNAEFDPNADDLIDPSEPLLYTAPRDRAAALILAAARLEFRQAGTTERAVQAKVTRERNAHAKATARYNAFNPWKHDDATSKPDQEPRP